MTMPRAETTKESSPKPKFKVGDELVCIGERSGEHSLDGGGGWEKGFVFKVKRITEHVNDNKRNGSHIYWSAKSGYGVYESHLKLYKGITISRVDKDGTKEVLWHK